ncbi:hypothetical protein ACWD26_38415 [Streptomyces sp. NPDC002787]
MWVDAMVTNFIKGDAQRTYLKFTTTTVDGWRAIQGGDFRSINETIGSPAVTAVFGAVLWTAFQWVPPILAYRTTMGQRWSLSRRTRIWRRYAALDAIARAVIACADVRVASLAKLPGAVRHLAEQLSRVEDTILTLYRYSDQLPARSHRRNELKKHAHLVVSQLRSAEARIDSEGDAALTPLASLLMKIAGRFIEGRIGALLDEADFEAELTPVRDWEPLRLASAAVLIAGCAVGVSLLSVPEGVATYLIGGCGVAIIALLYGRRVHNLLGLLDTIRGV